MSISPFLVLHITGGTLGIVSGAASMTFRKGSRAHALAGRVFVAAMLTMAACGVYLAVLKHQTGNIIGGTLTFYLVTTAWMTARHRADRTSPLNWAGFAVALGASTYLYVYGVAAARTPKHALAGVPAFMYFFLGTIALLCAAGDLRMLRHGVSGTRRLGRHLWRMCFALFIASGSLFLARPHLFPKFMSRYGILMFLTFLPLLLLVFWLIRIRARPVRIDAPSPLIRSAGHVLPHSTG